MKKIAILVLCTFTVNSYPVWFARITISGKSAQALKNLNSLSKKLVNTQKELSFDDVCKEIRNGNLTMTGAWLFAGGSPDAQSWYSNGYHVSRENSVLLSAIESGNKTCVEMLLKAGAKPKRYYNQPTKLALKSAGSNHDRIRIMQLLLEYGAFLNFSHLKNINDANIKCLSLLVKKLNFKKLSYKEKRAVVNELLECYSINTRVIASLLTCDVGLNIKDEKGETLLHYAVRVGNERLIPLLVQKGAHLLRNKDGNTPKDIAKRLWGKDDIRFLLLDELERNSTETCNSPKYIFFKCKKE